MYSTNALPPPPPLFNHEHHPLRLTSESTRSQPQGGCHYHHPAEQSPRCACQNYQHNRGAPGNVCDCGHSACYHSPNRSESRIPPDKILNALAEKVRKLEDVIVQEREQRRALLSQERSAWENEVRVLRNALVPVHRTENTLQRKLADLEHRLESADEENARLKDKLFAIDEANTAIERHLELFDVTKCLKRKASLGMEVPGVVSPGSNYTISSCASDTTSTSLFRASQPPSPPMATIGSPRSSGILNIKTTSKIAHGQQADQGPKANVSGEEARSSGFLSIDLAERFRKQTLERRYQNSTAHDVKVPCQTTARKSQHDRRTPPSQARTTTGALAVSDLLSYDVSPYQTIRAHKKVKQQNGPMSGLELLASAATPLAQNA